MAEVPPGPCAPPAPDPPHGGSGGGSWLRPGWRWAQGDQRAFEASGWVQLRGLLSAKGVRAAQRWVTAAMAGPNASLDLSSTDLQRRHPCVAALAAEPELGRAAAAACGCDSATLFQAQLRCKQPAQAPREGHVAWHIDGLQSPAASPAAAAALARLAAEGRAAEFREFTLWLALDPVSEGLRNGTMEVLSGMHTCGPLSAEGTGGFLPQFETCADDESLRRVCEETLGADGYAAAVAAAAEGGAGLRRAYALEPGDAGCHGADTPHRSLPNVSPEAVPRRALVLRWHTDAP